MISLFYFVFGYYLPLYLICNDFFSKHTFLELLQLALKNPNLIDDKYDNDNHKKLLYEFRLSIRKYELGEYTSSKVHAENALQYFPDSFLLIYNLYRTDLAISGIDLRRVKLQAFDELAKKYSLVIKSNEVSLLTKLKYYLRSVLFPLLNIFNPSDN